MNPVSEYFHLLFRGSRFYLPLIILCFLAGVVQKYVSFSNDFLGYVVIIVTAYRASRLWKASGETAFWLGKPMRPWLVALYPVSILFFAGISYYAGAAVHWLLNGLHGDLVFWYHAEKLPLLLFVGLIFMSLFTLSSTGGLMFRHLVWIAGFWVGFIFLLSRYQDSVPEFITDGLEFLVEEPEYDTGILLLGLVGGIAMIAALIFRYMKRQMVSWYIALVAILFLGTLAWSKLALIPVAFESEKPELLPAIDVEGELVKDGGTVKRMVRFTVPSKGSSTWFRVFSKYGFDDDEAWEKRRKMATYQALGLSDESMADLIVEKLVDTTVRSQIAEIEFWETESIGDLDLAEKEQRFHRGVSDGASFIYAFAAREANPFPLMPEYGCNPAWSKYGDDFSNQFSAVAIDNKGGSEDYLKQRDFQSMYWRKDRQIRFVVHRLKSKQIVRLTVID